MDRPGRSARGTDARSASGATEGRARAPSVESDGVDRAGRVATDRPDRTSTDQCTGESDDRVVPARDRTVSRRRALAVGGTLLTATTAGCSSVPGASDVLGSSDSPPDFASWLPAAPIQDSASPLVTFETLFELATVLPENHSRIQELSDLAAEYRLGAHQLDGRLTVDTADGFATLLTGSFSANATLAGWDVEANRVTSVGEFTVVGESQAVGPGAIVLASTPEQYVETHLGDRERVGDADEHWSAALADVAGGHLARLAAPDVRPYEVIALSVDVGSGPSFSGTSSVHFDSASAAEEHAGALDGDVAELSSDDVDTVVTGRSVSGNVVEVEVGYETFPF